MIDIIIFLVILLSLRGTLSKYLFLSCFTSLRYLLLALFIITTTFYNIFCSNNFTLSKCCLENINTNINKSHQGTLPKLPWSHTSFYLNNNVFLFGQKETISVSSTPNSSITSYNHVIFYFIGAILSIIFYKKDNFNIKKQLLPFLLFFFFVLVVILSINQENVEKMLSQ